MITVHYSAEDLTKLRFAYRPLLEIPLSYRVLINPTFHSPYLKWVDEARSALHDFDTPFMDAVIEPMCYIPDFVTPAPKPNRQDIYADLEDMVATPDATIQADILQLIQYHGDSEIRCYFLANPRDAMRCLAEEMAEYWRRVLAHYWLRMASTLESDILYHGRMLALDGSSKLFEDLHPTISCCDSRLDMQPVCDHYHESIEVSLVGSGFQLVPVIFKGCGRMYQNDDIGPFMLAYGVRGTGLWYEQAFPASQSLELALGVGRARVLIALTTPRNNGELARVLHLTSGAVSQHVARLCTAGLVEHHRVSKRVYFRLTQRGEELINLFERIN